MQQDLHPRIVLCADDDPDDRELLCETVRHLDPALKIMHNENGEQLIGKLKELESIGVSPCLIILDMNMPIMDGRTALAEIKKNPEWNDIPSPIFHPPER